MISINLTALVLSIVFFLFTIRVFILRKWDATLFQGRMKDIQNQLEDLIAFKRARAAVQEVILEKTMGKAEAAIRSNITTDDQTMLMNDYLEKVVA